MGGRVAVLSPEGQFGTVDEKDAEAVVKAGGRVLSGKEKAEKELEAEYAQKSTGEKVAQAALGRGIGPTSEALLSGGRQGLTAGLYEGALRQGIQAVAGPTAGAKFAAHEQAVEEASPIAHGAGEATGMVGGALIGAAAGGGAMGAATRLIPGAGISALGGAAEGGAARVLGGLAGRGVLGRAAASGLALGAQGLVEGAAYGGGQAIGDAMLQDTDLAADKLFASMGHGALWGAGAGVGLGVAGSLTKSALGGVLSRARRPAAELAEEAAGETAAHEPLPAPKGELGAESPQVAASARPIAESAKATAETGTLREAAYDRAWRATGGRKAFAAEANARLPNGTDDVGEVFLRHKVIDADGAPGVRGVVDAAMAGKYSDIAERIAAPLNTVGQRLGEIADTSAARIPVTKISEAFDKVAEPLSKKVGHEGIERGVRDAGFSLLEKLGITDASQTVAVKDLLTQRQALDDLIYREAKSLDPGGRVGALREVRGHIEGIIESSLDDASGKVPGELRAEYKQLKHDYTALKIGQKAAEDSINRGAANRTFSLTDKMIGTASGMVGGAIGGPVGGLISGPAAAAVSKLVRERADAAAAVALHKLSNSQALSKLVDGVDKQIGKAARGLLAEPPKKALPETPKGTSRQRAVTAMRRVAELQADPERFADRVQRETEPIAATHPDLAQAIVQRRVQAASFLASKVPVQPDRDPLDPHPAPHMSDAQAAEFARYAWYVEKPGRFFDELAQGKVTHEGAEVARTLMPRAFEELQMRTLDALATQMARGKAPPFDQRVRLGNLLQIPADVSQRVPHMEFLQTNVQPIDQTATIQGPSAGPSRHSPVKLPTQQSRYDRLEAR